MPLTPFIGISVLIHLIIIAWGKLWSFIQPEADQIHKTKPDPLIIHKIASVLIVIGVFSAVAVNAFILIKASVADHYSSVSLVESYFADQRTATQPLTIVTVTVPKAQAEACARPSDPSVVNYLRSHNQNITFEYRETLADSLHIKNYKGTAHQNIQLLTIMTNCNH